MIFLSHEIDGCRNISDSQGARSQISETLFTKRLYDISLIRSHDFSRWETLTSDIEGYKKSCDALRPPSGKEVGTTVLALSGVNATSYDIEIER